jgi:DNA polymerase III epsilon subunit-like protein
MATKIKKAPLDVETGGTQIGFHSLLTLYICVLSDEGQVADELDIKLKPDDLAELRVEQEALDVNGIDLAAHLADPETLTYTQGREKFIEFCKRNMSGKRSLRPAGHNIAGFDIPFIKTTLGIPHEEWEQYFHYRILDTMPIVTMFQDAGWLPDDLGSQESLVKYYGVQARKAHVAKNDTLMWVDVYHSMVRALAERKSGGGSSDEILILE